jgi:hypothetical protein
MLVLYHNSHRQYVFTGFYVIVWWFYWIYKWGDNTIPSTLFLHESKFRFQNDMRCLGYIFFFLWWHDQSKLIWATSFSDYTVEYIQATSFFSKDKYYFFFLPKPVLLLKANAITMFLRPNLFSKDFKPEVCAHSQYRTQL